MSKSQKVLQSISLLSGLPSCITAVISSHSLPLQGPIMAINGSEAHTLSLFWRVTSCSSFQWTCYSFSLTLARAFLLHPHMGEGRRPSCQAHLTLNYIAPSSGRNGPEAWLPLRPHLLVLSLRAHPEQPDAPEMLLPLFEWAPSVVCCHWPGL